MKLHAAQIQEARGWLADCGIPGAARLTDNQTHLLIARMYDGGVPAFHLATAVLCEVNR